jgi:hypothetical protein
MARARHGMQIWITEIRPCRPDLAAAPSLQKLSAALQHISADGARRISRNSGFSREPDNGAGTD